MSRWEMHARVTWGTGITDRHFIVEIGTPVVSLTLRQMDVMRSTKKKSTGSDVRGTVSGGELEKAPHCTGLELGIPPS